VLSLCKKSAKLDEIIKEFTYLQYALYSLAHFTICFPLFDPAVLFNIAFCICIIPQNFFPLFSLYFTLSVNSFYLCFFLTFRKIVQAQEVWIRGRPFKGIAGKKSVFVGYDGSRCGVEQLCLQYYRFKYNMQGIYYLFAIIIYPYYVISPIILFSSQFVLLFLWI
jgi:hypothetical protein